jgi:hypothetical protein
MGEEKSRARRLTEDLIEAGYKSVEELIEVAKAKIIKDKASDDELAAEKMKNAAAAKKLAIDDAFSILRMISDKEAELSEEDGEEPKEKKKKKEPKNLNNLGPESRAK